MFSPKYVSPAANWLRPLSAVFKVSPRTPEKITLSVLLVCCWSVSVRVSVHLLCNGCPQTPTFYWFVKLEFQFFNNFQTLFAQLQSVVAVWCVSISSSRVCSN